MQLNNKKITRFFFVLYLLNLVSIIMLQLIGDINAFSSLMTLFFTIFFAFQLSLNVHLLKKKKSINGQDLFILMITIIFSFITVTSISFFSTKSNVASNYIHLLLFLYFSFTVFSIFILLLDNAKLLGNKLDRSKNQKIIAMSLIFIFIPFADFPIMATKLENREPFNHLNAAVDYLWDVARVKNENSPAFGGVFLRYTIDTFRHFDNFDGAIPTGATILGLYYNYITTGNETYKKMALSMGKFFNPYNENGAIFNNQTCDPNKYLYNNGTQDSPENGDVYGLKGYNGTHWAGTTGDQRLFAVMAMFTLWLFTKD
ncbi:MAG: hypothetical protein ACTSVI_06875, partial [Promethearchaeota archaeon]